MDENKEMTELARRPKLAYVRQYVSDTSTPVNLYYGDKLVASCPPPNSFDIVFGGVKIQSIVYDTFYKHSGQRVGFIRSLSVTVNGHPAPILKPMAKTVIGALVALGKIKMPLDQALRDHSNWFR